MKERFYQIASQTGCHITRYEYWKDGMQGWQVSISYQYHDLPEQFDDCWLGGDKKDQDRILEDFKRDCLDLKAEFHAQREPE